LYNESSPPKNTKWSCWSPGKITALLKAWAGGDLAAHEQLVPLVYRELHRLAQYYRRNAGAGDTLQTTALVHEAYLRLVDINDIDWRGRSHFFAVSAQLMRRILVDAARAHAAAKRGGPHNTIDWLDLDGLPAPDSYRAGELVALDDALTSLTQLDPRRATVVELRVFGGLSVDETAQALELSPQSVMRDWKVAKAWLLRELTRESASRSRP
jgi:RNA polymerase sigma factor (TIGR02999 family)